MILLDAAWSRLELESWETFPRQEPDGRAFGEGGQGAGDDSPPDAGVVADSLAHQHLAPVEQLGLTGSIEDAARAPVGDGVGLERRATSLGERLTLEEHPLVLHEYRGRVGAVPGGLVSRSGPGAR